MSYLTLFAEKPKVFVPVPPQELHGAFGRAQAAVGGRSVDALAVVLELHVSGTLEARLALADDGHHVLLCVGEQDVALRQLPYSPLVQILQFLVRNTQNGPCCNMSQYAEMFS
ncbi:hypothetical protein EYF80_063596 [Liparis tanakae]|uniref:Uncharacterized protein n=1 Tax=Liparis tanakae TaxID=230148 RepID=A0A4Z2EBK5_9TELE|nr:hypothetical protein EYF80_063596 [Liparis tanakae]